MTITQLRNEIDLLIKTNGNREITGAIANQVLNDMVDVFEVNGIRFSYQEGQPTGITAGDMWYKGSTTELYRYNGSTWDLIVAFSDYINTITSVNEDIPIFDGTGGQLKDSGKKLTDYMSTITSVDSDIVLFNGVSGQVKDSGKKLTDYVSSITSVDSDIVLFNGVSGQVKDSGKKLTDFVSSIVSVDNNIPLFNGLLGQLKDSGVSLTSITNKIPYTTVGTSGYDYTSVSAAIAAGKSNILIMDSITEVGNWILTKNVFIELLNNSVTITMSTFSRSGNFDLYIKGNGGTITFVTSSSCFTGTCVNYLYNINITNLSTASNKFFASSTSLVWDTGNYTMANYNATGIASLSYYILKNINIIGIGTGSAQFNSIGSNPTFNYQENIRITGTWATNANLDNVKGCDVNVLNSTVAGYLICERTTSKNFNIQNIYFPNGSFQFVNSVDGNIDKFQASGIVISGSPTPTDLRLTNGFFTTAITMSMSNVTLENVYITGTLTLSGNNIKCINVTVSDNITISGDRNILSNCKVGTVTPGIKTITINNTADDTIIDNTIVEATIVENGVRTRISGCSLWDGTKIADKIPSLIGTGSRIVKADANGVLSATDSISTQNSAITYVGSSEVYTTLQAAVNASKTNIILTSSITESVAITTSNKVFVDLNGFTITFGAYKITTTGTGSFNMKNGSISYAFSSTSMLFENQGTAYNILTNVNATNGSTAADTPIAMKYFRHNGGSMVVPNYGYVYLGASTSPNSYWGTNGYCYDCKISDINITGGGSGMYNLLKGDFENDSITGCNINVTSAAAVVLIDQNNYLTSDKYSLNNTYIVSGNSRFLCNATNTNFTTGTFYGNGIGGSAASILYLESNILKLTQMSITTLGIGGGGCLITNCNIEDCSIGSAATLTQISNCHFINDVAVDGDYTFINNSRVGALSNTKTFIIGASANKTTITNCLTEAAISNSGTNSTLDNNITI